MKRINLFLLLLLSTLSFAQSWQSKDVVRIENTESSFHYTFRDSTTLYIQKQNISYIVSLPNSNYIQVGYLYEGATSKIMSCTYNTLTQPLLGSNAELADTLNAWLNEPSTGGGGGGGGSQTLSISNDTLTISNGNSVILPIYFQSDSATITSYDVLNSQNAPPISPNTGDTYLVGTSPSGAWVGHAKDIAEWNGSAWVFTDGIQGDFLYNATTALTYIFRSGNWVQTTGIPALHNGNNISSGLKIGTNNARSLTFETNNIPISRFDSIGRFYVYDTSLRHSNKYLQIDSITGRLIASAISANSGSSTLFPNGVKLVMSSRAFQADDKDYVLLCPVPSTTITMPTTNPFSEGDYVGVVMSSPDSYFETYNNGSGGTDKMYPYTQNPSGTTLEQQSSSEVVILRALNQGNLWILPLCGAVKTSNDINGSNYKTLARHNYDKSQNAIPLSGTEVGSPVTGNIQIKNNQAIYSYGSDNTSYGSFGVEDDKLIISYNTANQSTLTINENGINVDCVNSTSKGLFSSLYYYENAKDDDNAFAQYGGIRDIIGNLRFTISKSETATDADFNAAPGTAYMLSEVADNDKVITLTSPVDGDIYRFNNVTQPTNNWITNVTIFLSDGTTSNVVPASKITIIQYDAAASVFHLISSQ